jgi:hypothetical protein
LPAHFIGAGPGLLSRAPRPLGALLLLACMVLDGGHASAASRAPTPFPAQFTNAEIFAGAIGKASSSPLGARPLSGITVPHHLLAADLIARAFGMVERTSIDKVVVLFPDHYAKTSSAFATTRRPFETVFGRIDIDEAGVRSLRRLRDLVE